MFVRRKVYQHSMAAVCKHTLSVAIRTNVAYHSVSHLPQQARHCIILFKVFPTGLFIHVSRPRPRCKGARLFSTCVQRGRTAAGLRSASTARLTSVAVKTKIKKRSQISAAGAVSGKAESTQRSASQVHYYQAKNKTETPYQSLN